MVKLVTTRLAIPAVFVLGVWSTALAQGPSIDTLALRAHTYFLAQDLLQGRATGSTGASVAAAYIASQCRMSGWLPVGPSYFHPVPVERAQLLHMTLMVVAGRDTARMAGAHLALEPGTRTAIAGFSGPASFMAEDSPPVPAGAIAVTSERADRGVRDSLAARGVRGLVQLTSDTSTYRRYAARLNHARWYLADSATPSSFHSPLPAVLLDPSASAALLAMAYDVDEAAGAVRREITISVTVSAQRESVWAPNVICQLPGMSTQRADTAIVLAAHYDHLGVGPPDATGDSIYNGFSDNAAGVAMLLALGTAWSALDAAPFAHTILLVFFTAEELGLLGSDYYAARPPWRLEQTKAVITVDAGAPPAPPTSWELAGAEGSMVGNLAARVARARGWDIRTSAARPISDFYPFAVRGIGALLVIPGSAPYEGLSLDGSVALKQQWDHYHRPADEWSSTFPWSGLQRYAEYVALIVAALDRVR